MNGSITPIDVPGAINTWALGINDSGEIVGYRYDAQNKEHGFVRSADGTIASFDVPEAVLGTEGDAIDNKGNVAGFYLDQNDNGHGYFRQPDGTLTTFDVGAGTFTGPMAMNAKGAIVGIDDKKPRGKEQGFVWYRSGKVKTITAPHNNGDTVALDINKDGVVVGSFSTWTDHHSRGTRHGFIWTP